MKLTREDVLLAYRYFLGRQPESVEVVDAYMMHCPNLNSIRSAIIKSDEFKSILGATVSDGAHWGYWGPRQPIDVHVDSATMDRLVERVRGQWSRLGEDDPYWGVLTDDRYKSSQIDDVALAEFRESGRETASLVEAAIGRGMPVRAAGTCVELGCGVGRITRYLADRFDKVIAIDISPGNLELCQRYLAEEGVRNVEVRLLRSLNDLVDVGGFDWLFSIIVLQHNSPPIQWQILRALLPKILPSGAFIFQTVSDLPGYSFNAEDYLASDDPVMEIHSLPQSVIFKLIDECGLKLNAVRTDTWTGAYGSYTYEGYRP